MCLRESDGKLLYEYVSPRLPNSVNDVGWGGLGCSPLIEGDRLWFTTNRCETVSLDIGPLKRGEGEPRLAWKVDMMNELGVFPRALLMGPPRTCSIAASYKDRIFVGTGNGVDQSYSKVSAPEAPSLICLDKNTGELLWKDNSPGANILHAQLPSPLVIEINGRGQVITPQGAGWVRSFDALTGEVIWAFDINPKTSMWVLGRGARNEILATPVLHDGRIYIASGQYPEHGDGPGRLCCIDPTKTGDNSSELAVDADGNGIPHRRLQAVDATKGERAVRNPNSGLVWEFAGSTHPLPLDDAFENGRANGLRANPTFPRTVSTSLAPLPLEEHLSSTGAKPCGAGSRHC
jgi:outer membrane protein assembly factor BamB